MADEKKEVKKPEENAPKKETAMDKKVTDKKGRDWSKPACFKRDGEV